MKQMYVAFILVLFVVLFASTENFSQQVLDSANVLTQDNLSDNNTSGADFSGTNLSGANYREYPPLVAVATANGWWTNNGGTAYGGNHRRSSRDGTGVANGARALYSFDVPTSDYFMVYHHMVNSGNSSPNAKVKFYRFGEGFPVDTFYYNQKEHNITYNNGGHGSWVPFGIVEVFAGDSALTVEIGADENSPQIIRTDAMRILRSSAAGADLEFGKRRSDWTIIEAASGDTTFHTSFFYDGFYFSDVARTNKVTSLARADLNFPQTTFKGGGTTEITFPVYNLGSEPLVITGLSVQTSRFTVTTPTPIVIQPGGESSITVVFAPLGEEFTVDTLSIESNDAAEPVALQPIRGEGINYNFILNASEGGAEPHWNAPVGAAYEEIGTFISSAVSPFQYPIIGGNIRSRVSTTANPVAAIYKFTLLDSLFGSYYVEYSGPAGSSNAAQNLTVDVVTPFYSNPLPELADTQRVTGFNSRIINNPTPIWAAIGNQVFTLNGGGETTVRYTNPNQPSDFVRADLLRIRLVPLAPDIITSVDPSRILNFGSVSIFDSVRLGDFNFQRNIVFGSKGETPLVIDTMYLASGLAYEAVNMPTFPLSLPAIDGEFNLLINFLPDEISLHGDLLYVKSNDPNDTLSVITLSGQGVGTGITVDNADPSTSIFPADVVPAGTVIDNTNNFKWIESTGGSPVNGTGLFTSIYKNPTGGLQRIEWFPDFPFNPNNPGVNEPDSFDVSVQIPTSSPNSSPRALYRIKHFNGTTDTVISQLNRTLNGGQIPLGRYTFLRGGKDSPGSGTIFGSVELLNDTALVSAFFADSLTNMARDSGWVLRADAIILAQASNVIVGVEDLNLLPTAYYMSQNYPNPFNPTTQIRFALPQSGMVELKIYDILGREVATLLNGEHNAGTYTVEWSGRNNYGVSVSSGMYIYRISAGNFVQTKKMMMLK